MFTQNTTPKEKVEYVAQVLADNGASGSLGWQLLDDLTEAEQADAVELADMMWVEKMTDKAERLMAAGKPFDALELLMKVDAVLVSYGY